MLLLGFGGVVGSEFLPTWTKAPSGSGNARASSGPTQESDLARRARQISRAPRGKQMVSQVGRPMMAAMPAAS